MQIAYADGTKGSQRGEAIEPDIFEIPADDPLVAVEISSGVYVDSVIFVLASGTFVFVAVRECCAQGQNLRSSVVTEDRSTL